MKTYLTIFIISFAIIMVGGVIHMTEHNSSVSFWYFNSIVGGLLCGFVKRILEKEKEGVEITGYVVSFISFLAIWIISIAIILNKIN